VIDLIGRPYRLGADGTDADGAIDCIHLVYNVLDRLGIATPDFKASWYDNNWRAISRDLLCWGRRIKMAEYDGDVLVLPQANATFAVTWSNGCLYVNQHLMAVAWCPIGKLSCSHCFRTKSG
jgi:hypothetical protein